MKKILILSALMAALASANAMAADANITFGGTVSDATCTLAAADASKVLTIPNVSAATLYAAGSTGYLTYNASSSFAFSACPASLTKVISNYTYQGTVVSGTAGGSYMATGAATNVALTVMQNATATTATVVSANGTSGTVNQTTIASNAATVPVTVGARAVNAAGVVTLPTAGTYSGVYTVAFTYS